MFINKRKNIFVISIVASFFIIVIQILLYSNFNSVRKKTKKQAKRKRKKTGYFSSKLILKMPRPGRTGQ